MIVLNVPHLNVNIVKNLLILIKNKLISKEDFIV